MKSETEIRRAAEIARKHWINAINRGRNYHAPAVGSALAALLWAAGDDSPLASDFADFIDGTRADLQTIARRN